MQSKATTVNEYLAGLPEERRAVVTTVRKVVKKNLAKGFKEGMQYGMIGYFVPHSLYSSGYHCDPQQPLPFAGLAAQKNHYALYLMCLYEDAQLMPWFKAEWTKTGKKLDLGKACLRFKKLEDLSLDLIGQLIAQVTVKDFIANYEAARAKSKTARDTATKKTGTKKTAGQRLR